MNEMHKARFFTDMMVRNTERRVNRIHSKLSDKITFGKHRGKTIETIILEDPNYIRWALDSIPNFDLDEEAKKVWRNRMLAKEADETEQS